MARLILASNSPQRFALLKQQGLTFEVVAADVDETPLDGESAQQYVERVAFAKATRILNMYPDAVVLAADTCISLDDRIIGKPKTKQHAYDIWQQLSGREHHVLSGVCVSTLHDVYQTVVKTNVTFQVLSQEEMQEYWATGEPIGRAGAYAIQGIGARYIPKIEGSYSNVVGLPIHETLKLLYKAIKALN